MRDFSETMKQINKNENNRVKNPSWREADQLAIYNRRPPDLNSLQFFMQPTDWYIFHALRYVWRHWSVCTLIDDKN